MDRNDELTIGARSKGWEIFSPQWDYLAEIPALELGSICAMSVGLHPYFASPAWVLLVAMPHFDGTDSDEWYPLEDAKKGAERAKRLKEFLKRAHVACANLAPLGHLPIAAGEPNSEKTVVRVADFAVWAASRGWELPAEFPKPVAEQPRSAGAKPLPEEVKHSDDEMAATPAVEQPTCAEAQPIPSGEQIPGKLPRIAVGRLAVKAAWEIELETKRAATVPDVMKRLQSWADEGKEPEYLIRSDRKKKCVVWNAGGKEKDYDEKACGKAIERWKINRR